jgi:hypothetical protein
VSKCRCASEYLDLFIRGLFASGLLVRLHDGGRTGVFGNATNATGVNFGVQTIWEARIERRHGRAETEGASARMAIWKSTTTELSAAFDRS